MNSNYERALSADQSIRIAEEAIRCLNLRASDEAYGIDLQTYRCKLIDDHDQTIFYGFGKGLGAQSKASAYYEALEHYSIHQFAQVSANNQDNYMAIDPYEHILPGVDLVNIDSNEKIFYPIFMLDPRYAKKKSKYDKMDYSTYTYLANDSGVASGTNMTEASIHALNELVERDAHSLFLIEAFIKNKNQRIRLIDKTSLPSLQQNIIQKIEHQYNDNLMILDITSEIGIPVIYVSMTKQPFLIQPSGCGASLKAEYALERALLESLQPVHIYNEKLIDNQKEIIKQLSELPMFLKAAVADVTSFVGKYQVINFSSVHHDNENLTLIDQYNAITQKIKKIGCKIFKLPIMDLACGFSCVKYCIPDFEQFHLVQTGKHILPNQRGMRLLDNEIDGARNE
jgi:ribosomal protein S12 methylthiotransferase accessory factor